MRKREETWRRTKGDKESLTRELCKGCERANQKKVGV